MAQISLSIPDAMLKTARTRAKAEGYRSVQEYLLQALRDKWFIDNLPRYEKLYKEAKAHGFPSSDLPEYFRLIEKGSAKEREAFLKARPIQK